ncbi:MAG: hypothetical protein KGO92_13750 [Bacteroidota bacterium]|nr:hypothetical protein [Bacteroidota bacterium]
MPGIFKSLMLVFCLLGLEQLSFAQTDSAVPKKIAVIAPLYLDTAFHGDNYQLGKNNLPAYMIPGLDFYNGVMLAIDSLNKENAPIEVLFFDSKSITDPVTALVNKPEMQDVSLIIASFNNRNDIRPLADFALSRKIPLISATYPNSGGVRNNPYFVLLNPTLSAHIEAIYQYLHRYYPTETILYFRKEGAVDNLIENDIHALNEKTPGLPIKFSSVVLTDSFTQADVTDHLDSTRQNIVFCGSLDEKFGLKLSAALSANQSYPVTAIGMPTWDGLKDISKDLSIIYSTPYQHRRADKTSIRVAQQYMARFQTPPSDMVYKGFETMYHFTRLLLWYPENFMGHLSDKAFKVFNEYQIEPSHINRESGTTDYLENKKLYFIQKKDGIIQSVR